MLWTRICLVAGLSLTVANGVFAQGTPFEPQYATSSFASRSVRIVVPAQFHPEVAVSRKLAAQPVHPYMVKVIFGDIRQNTGGATMTTWIDPLHRLDVPDGMDEGHSLVRAQRLYLSLSGITTENINEIRYQSWKQQQKLAGQSRAYIIISPRARHLVHADDMPRPLMMIPAHRTPGIPGIPETPTSDPQNAMPTVPQNPQPSPAVETRLMAANN